MKLAITPLVLTPCCPFPIRVSEGRLFTSEQSAADKPGGGSGHRQIMFFVRTSRPSFTTSRNLDQSEQTTYPNGMCRLPNVRHASCAAAIATRPSRGSHLGAAGRAGPYALNQKPKIQTQNPKI